VGQIEMEMVGYGCMEINMEAEPGIDGLLISTQTGPTEALLKLDPCGRIVGPLADLAC
jgi:hypothetical protein